MASTLLVVNRQTAIVALLLLFFLWTLSTFTRPVTHHTPTASTGQIFHRPPTSGADAASRKGPPKTAIGGSSGNEHAHKQEPDRGHKDARPKTKSAKPSASSSSADRPLILYAYAESEAARANLEFFLAQGLHAAADFVFILNGETNVTSLIPQKKNIVVVTRPNTCFDLGAFGEVLRRDGRWKKYKWFITMNASIRGPFLPHWSRGCWSDLYLDRITDKVKLVGMTANCWPRFHVQSMIWATDSTGMALLLDPPANSSVADEFGDAAAAVGLSGCYDGWNAAVHAEIGSTAIITGAGYEVDLMMAAYHGKERYAEECDTSENGDLLWDGKYFGSNIHPYETIFIKANRDIDPTLIGHLTEWHLASGRTSWDTCGSGR